jgi:hypothetical protein
VITRRALPLAIGLSWYAFARPAPSAPSRSLSSLDPTDIVSILAQDQVLSPHRTVRLAAHIGDLLIDGENYPAINLIEEHVTAHSKRSFRRVVLLKPDLRKAYALPYYSPARPVPATRMCLSFRMRSRSTIHCLLADRLNSPIVGRTRRCWRIGKRLPTAADRTTTSRSRSPVGTFSFCTLVYVLRPTWHIADLSGRGSHGTSGICQPRYRATG